MIEQQQIIIDFKNYITNIRSRIFNDNKAGLTDPAKIFEGIIVELYNIYYSVDDFKGFVLSNQICLDIKSDSCKIAVSIKAREVYQSKKQIEKIVKKFKESYPELDEYELILQELCDKPKTKITNDKLTIRYFGELTNLFNDDPVKLTKLKKFIEKKSNSIKTISYLNLINENYLKEINSYIVPTLGFSSNNFYEYLNINEAIISLENFNNYKNILLPKIIELWREIKGKDYLKLDISEQAIEFLDRLWKLGSAKNNFNPIDPSIMIKDLNEEIWKNHLQHKESYIFGLYIYIVRIHELSIDLNKILRNY